MFFSDRWKQRGICYKGGGGGTSTNSTVYQDTELSKQQAAILQQLAPYIQGYGAEALSAERSLVPQQADYTRTMLGLQKQYESAIMPLQQQYAQTLLPAQTQLIPLLADAMKGQTQLATKQTGMQNQILDLLGPRAIASARGDVTPERMQNTQRAQQYVRQTGASMGVKPGDARMASNLRQVGESTTKPSNDIMSMAQALFGSQANIPSISSLNSVPGQLAGNANSLAQIDPSFATGLLGMMGSGPRGSTSQQQVPMVDTTAQDVTAGIGTAATIAMLAYMLS